MTLMTTYTNIVQEPDFVFQKTKSDYSLYN